MELKNQIFESRRLLTQQLKVPCLLHPASPAGLPFLPPFDAQDFFLDAERLFLQPGIAASFYIVGPLLAFQL